MIDIDERTADVRKQWRKQQVEERLAWGPAWTDTGLVFTKEDGVGFEKLVVRHGMPRITLHKLRHLAASLQIAAGIDIGIVS